MKTKTNKELLAENIKLRLVAKDLHWMARRYADGRISYAVSMLNDITADLLEMDVKLNPCGENKLFARDGKAKIETGLFILPEKYEQLEKDYCN